MEDATAKLRSELATVKANLEITLGRANGLHLALVVIARGWGKPATQLISHLEDALEKVEATALPTPLPDATIQEARRVGSQVLELFRHAAREGG